MQTDYRELPTANNNAAFGYNFEGGLQEYCIVDERVALDAKGERFLIPVGEEKSASAIALVEPWACVEGSYQNRERQAVKAGGRPADRWRCSDGDGGVAETAGGGRRKAGDG